MKIRELRAVLDQLKRLYRVGDAKSAAKDLEAVSAALEDHDNQSVQEFVTETQQRLAAGDKSQIRSTAKGDRAADVERYVRQLADAGTSKTAFYRVFDQLKSDTNIKIAEADIVARRYTGYKSTYRKKQAAFEDIEKVFIERARFENKMNATG